MSKKVMYIAWIVAAVALLAVLGYCQPWGPVVPL